MLINELNPELFTVIQTLSFIKVYLNELDAQIRLVNPNYKLSTAQCLWLGFMLSAILVTNSLCWEAYSRTSIGKHKASKLRWMFKHTKLPWEKLLLCSVKAILKRYSITEGLLVLDDSDLPRSKHTSKLYGVHKLKDKTSGGFIKGQNIVLLLLVTDKVTIPVGFNFYLPDPEWVEWKAKDRQLRKNKVAKSGRPVEPKRSNEYPSKLEISGNLVEEFVSNFPEVKVKALLADCLYGNKKLKERIDKLGQKIQIISQIRSNQLVKLSGKNITVTELFKRYPGIPTIINIRGQSSAVNMRGMRVQVNAYGCKLMVIALKYAGEDDYRYITATDLSWRAIDIANAYTLRWLIEVFFQDWKTSEGWQRAATQQGEIGSRRGVLLSLLTDHALLMHPEQTNRIDAGLPAVTVGSLSNHIKVEAFIDSVEAIIESDSPKSAFEKLSKQMLNLYELRESKKHLVGYDMSNFKGRYGLEKKYA